jgi:RNA polymerase sigma-70 factor (ECF subfamily)
LVADLGEPELSAAGEPPLADESTFRALYPTLRRFAAFCADARTDPDDLVQEALCGYLRRDPRSVERLEPYLRRSIYHAAVQRTRDSARKPTTSLTDEDARSVENPERDDSGRLLRLVSTDHRAALFLVDVLGLPSTEAGAVLGISSIAVRARVSRARKAMRRALEGSEQLHG